MAQTLEDFLKSGLEPKGRNKDKITSYDVKVMKLQDGDIAVLFDSWNNVEGALFKVSGNELEALTDVDEIKRKDAMEDTSPESIMD